MAHLSRYPGKPRISGCGRPGAVRGARRIPAPSSDWLGLVYCRRRSSPAVHMLIDDPLGHQAEGKLVRRSPARLRRHCRTILTLVLAGFRIFSLVDDRLPIARPVLTDYRSSSNTWGDDRQGRRIVSNWLGLSLLVYPRRLRNRPGVDRHAESAQFMHVRRGSGSDIGPLGLASQR